MSRSVRRLMLLTDAPHFGGAERYLVDLCSAAGRRALETHVHWMAPNRGQSVMGRANAFAGSDLLDRCRVAGASVSRQSGAGTHNLYRTVRRFAPDAVIVNACGRPWFWQATWLCRVLGIPSVWVHHMVDPVDPRRLPARRFGGRMQGLNAWRVPQWIRHRLAAEGAAACICSNDADAEYLTRWRFCSLDKLVVISPGIDAAQWSFDAAARTEMRRAWFGSADALILGTAARLVDGKGIDRVVDALCVLRERHANAKLVIAGAGPAESQIRQLICARGLTNQVRLAGEMHNLAGFYSAIDLFVLASRTESFGLTLTEAMACRRPVVATPTTGARRQIEDARTGWLATDFTVAGLTDAIERALTTRDVESTIERAHAQATSRFTIDRTLEETLTALAPRRVPRIVVPPPATSLLSHEVPA